LLPTNQAKLYARLDFNVTEEIVSEDTMTETLRSLLSECERAHYDHTNSAVSHITVAHRDDLLFRLEQVSGAIQAMIRRISLVGGADEAIVAGVNSLEEMYPYQNAAMARIHITSSLASFYGTNSQLIYTDTPDQTSAPKP
jgi:hypothetical protein